MSKIKKIMCGVIVAAAVFSMSGCGNKTLFDTNYTFDKAIIYHNGYEQVVDIDKWDDYEGEQIQLKLTDGSIILVSSYNCILVNTKDGKSAVLPE